MSLPGTIVLRPIEGFTQPDYSVIYKDPDGREFGVGRIYRDTTGTVGGATLWFWTVEYHQRQGRAAPGQGQCGTLDEAKAAWRRCWDSADTPDTLAAVDAPGVFPVTRLRLGSQRGGLASGPFSLCLRAARFTIIAFSCFAASATSSLRRPLQPYAASFIASSSLVKNIHQGGPLQWGQISSATVLSFHDEIIVV